MTTPKQSNREMAEEICAKYANPFIGLVRPELDQAITQALDAKDAECKEKVERVVRAVEAEAKGWIENLTTCDTHKEFYTGCGWCEQRSDDIGQMAVAKLILAAARSAAHDDAAAKSGMGGEV